jgi:hypothetical protein
MDTIDLKDNVKIDKLLTTNPDMERKVRRIVRQVITAAMDPVKRAADRQSARKAAQAVRKAVYKKVLGGNLSILDSRGKAVGHAPLPPVRHRLETETNRKGNHRGGNRIPRSRRTEDLLTYQGRDTAFILRFLNSGTPNRDNNGVRYVGQISARHWFEDTSHAALQYAAEQLDMLLDALIAKEFNEQ